MKFYVIESNTGETIGCELTKRAALLRAESAGYTKDEINIESVECDVSAETVRRLLGNLGGYAK